MTWQSPSPRNHSVAPSCSPRYTLHRYSKNAPFSHCVPINSRRWKATVNRTLWREEREQELSGSVNVWSCALRILLLSVIIRVLISPTAYSWTRAGGKRLWTERCEDKGVNRNSAGIRHLNEVILLLVVCARINRPFTLPGRLHCPHCGNTIARLLSSIRPPLDLPFLCYTPYKIGNNKYRVKAKRGCKYKTATFSRCVPMDSRRWYETVHRPVWRQGREQELSGSVNMCSCALRMLLLSVIIRVLISPTAYPWTRAGGKRLWTERCEDKACTRTQRGCEYVLVCSSCIYVCKYKTPLSPTAYP